jgi:microcystin-dependent protein
MLGNFIEESANAPSTNVNVNLAGAPAGRQRFRSTFVNGAQLFYGIYDGTQAEWGIGNLTWGSPDVLSRTTVLRNTAGNTNRLNFTGAVRVFNEVPAERSVYIAANGLPNLDAGFFTVPSLATASGSGNVYQLSLNPPIGAYAPGLTVRFFAPFAHTGIAYININSKGAKPIVRRIPRAGTNQWDLRGGAIRAGQLVEVMYDGSNFRLLAPLESDMLPVGAIIPYWGWYLPPGYVWPVGQNLSRFTYPALHELVAASGYPNGAGDGVNTFGIPDLRGRAVFGLDNIGGIGDAQRLINGLPAARGTLGAAGGDDRLAAHSHSGVVAAATANITMGNAGNHIHGYVDTIAQGGGGGAQGGSGVNFPDAGRATDIAGDHGHPLYDPSHAHSLTIYNAGAGGSQNVPPAMMLNYILHAGT